MAKDDFRSYFAKCKVMLKLRYFCKIANINPVSLCRFMKGNQFNYELSLDACERLYQVINEELSKIA